MAVTLKTGLTLTGLVSALWPPVNQSADFTYLQIATDLEDASYSLKVSPSNLTVIHVNKAEIGRAHV